MHASTNILDEERTICSVVEKRIGEVIRVSDPLTKAGSFTEWKVVHIVGQRNGVWLVRCERV